jgi:eukaryotic-like serine/threonine-protein kinase
VTGPPADDELEPLVERCITAFETEGEAALERICAEHPARAPVLRERIRQLEELGLMRRADASQAESFPERLGDFKLVERIGAGGMGVVYRARQESIGREVALKIVRPEQLYFPQAKARFRREIETIGRLQHPSIVPVYCVGEEAGAPYFAMELLRGASLAQLLRSFAGREPSGLHGRDFARAVATIARDADVTPEAAEANWLFAGSWSESCARVVRQVADALAHAHGRGVLHRDVKPSNVVVTPRGRVVLLDFGLATSRADGEITRTGALLGSIPYFSPEQTRGDGKGLDGRTDVYSLGVTLYELLTLRLPYEQHETSALLAAIVAGRPRPPRALNRAVGRDFETVCLTAMNADRGGRYASAAEFARDLDNLLARRPIEARRAGALVHVARWMQREPAKAVALLLLLLLLVGGPLAYAAFQHRANVRLETARLRTDEQRSRADRLLQQARATIDRLVEPLRGEETDDIAEIARLKKEILLQAGATYASFSPAELADPAFQRDLGQLARQLGDIWRALNDRTEAKRSYQEAVDRLEPLALTNPQEVEPIEELAAARTSLAHLLADGGSFDDAIELLRAAIADLERLSPPDAAPARRTLIWCDAQGSAGLLLTAKGDQRDGEEMSRRAIDALRRLDRREGGAGRARAKLGEACTSLGLSLQWVSGRKADAEALLREAVDLFDDEARRDPDDRLSQKHAAEARISLARLQLSTRRGAEALETARSAVQILEPCVKRFPAVKLYRRNLAQALEEAADAGLALARSDDARRDADRALLMMRELRDSDPELDSLEFASAQVCLSHVLAAQRDPEAARRLAASSIDWIEANGGKLAPNVRAQALRTWRWDLLRYEAELGAGDRLRDGLREQLDRAAAPADWLRAARLLARGAVVVRHDEALTDGEQDERAGALEDALIAALQAAKQKGASIAELGDDPSILALASRPDARAALARAGLVLPDRGGSN